MRERLARIQFRVNWKSILFLAAVMTAVFFIALPLFDGGRAAVKGVYAGPLALASVNPADARILLQHEIDLFNAGGITLVVDGHDPITVTPAETGISFDVQGTLDAAYMHGRNAALPLRVLQQARALLFTFSEPVHITQDSRVYENFVSIALSSVHQPAASTSLAYNARTKAFDYVAAQNGLVLDLDELSSQINERAQTLSTEPVRLTRQHAAPLIDTTDVADARAQADRLLAAGPYTIVARDKEWEVEQDDLGSWVTIVPEPSDSGSYRLAAALSQRGIETYLSSFAPGLQTQPVNAQFTVQNGRVAAFALEQVGVELDIPQSARAVKDGIEVGQQRVSLAFREAAPEITSSDIDTLGITALLGSGTSDFGGSPTSRVHNISVGSNQFLGKLVAPGKEFSFNENLGAVSAKEGYLPELVIKNNKTTPEYGGGLCQVSTTLFRAAVNSGLEITERYNHSYPVRYYGTPGFDATIYLPNPDLKFANNTPGYVLIQYKIEGSQLTFEIYGQDDGRTVELDGPYTYDVKPDGSMKAWIKQTVRNAMGEVIEEKTFYSNYKSPDLYPVDRNPLE
jgi:vancomycin resistance protein YoaR